MGSRLLLSRLHRFTVARPSHLRRLSSRATPIPLPPSRTHATPPVWQRGRCGGWCRNYSHGAVTLVLREGQPRFETRELEPPKKEKWVTKKRLKLKRKREKRKRKEANVNDPRRIRPKGSKKNSRFLNAENRLLYKLEKAKLKEALLVEKLKKYEVPKLQGPTVKPDVLSGEERFYMKKMAQKKSNYVPIGRRGVFNGVILNMHLHWKKHETVKVICKPCKPGQIHEYAGEIARLSGGTPIQIIGDSTIIFYRGKNYVQPEVMSPIDTLSKKRALEKSKYEQSLESVRHFIAVSEKELELYHRHLSLYGDQNSKCPHSAIVEQKEMFESGSGILWRVVEGGSQQTGNGFQVKRKILGGHSDSGGRSSTENESFCGLQSDTDTCSDAGEEESIISVTDGFYTDLSDTAFDSGEEEESIISVTDGFYTDLSDTAFDSGEEVAKSDGDTEMENKRGDECVSNIRKYQTTTCTS